MKAIEYINKYYHNNGAFEYEKDWYASVLEDYAVNYYRSKNILIRLFNKIFKEKVKNPINKIIE